MPSETQASNPVGIDLGTTFSAIAYVNPLGTPELVPNAEMERLTPSVILFDGDNAVIGSAARQNAIAEPEKVVEFVKREMGRSPEQFSRELGGRSFTAAELSSLILRKLKMDAEVRLESEIREAVITVPAYFTDPERMATFEAGRLAGLDVLQLLNEPTAAALAYGLTRSTEDQTVFVFDLGGGTLDVTVMRMTGGTIEMLACNGDHHLGGKDWDDLLISHVAEEFERIHGVNPLLDLAAYQDLSERAVAAKLQLSKRDAANIVFGYQGDSVKMEITRPQFQSMAAGLLSRCESICQIALSEARLTWSDITHVVAVGGMIRMPMIRDTVVRLTGREPVGGVNPEEAVACGAALHARVCSANRKSAANTAPLGTSHPATGKLVEVRHITSHTLGIVLWDDAQARDYVYPMLPKLTPYPASKDRTFAVANAGSSSVRVTIVEGESSNPAECTHLGECAIPLPPSCQKGEPVCVCYAYDENQMLRVTAEVRGRTFSNVVERASHVSGYDAAEALAKIKIA